MTKRIFERDGQWFIRAYMQKPSYCNAANPEQMSIGVSDYKYDPPEDSTDTYDTVEIDVPIPERFLPKTPAPAPIQAKLVDE